MLLLLCSKLLYCCCGSYYCLLPMFHRGWDSSMSCCCPLHQIAVFFFFPFQHDIFSIYTLAVLSHLRPRFESYNSYHICAEGTGMRGAKVGVSPPRRSPPCISISAVLSHKRNSQSGLHIRILMPGCSPPCPPRSMG